MGGKNQLGKNNNALQLVFFFQQFPWGCCYGCLIPVLLLCLPFSCSWFLPLLPPFSTPLLFLHLCSCPFFFSVLVSSQLSWCCSALLFFPSWFFPPILLLSLSYSSFIPFSSHPFAIPFLLFIYSFFPPILLLSLSYSSSIPFSLPSFCCPFPTLLLFLFPPILLCWWGSSSRAAVVVVYFCSWCLGSILFL